MRCFGPLPIAFFGWLVLATGCRADRELDEGEGHTSGVGSVVSPGNGQEDDDDDDDEHDDDEDDEHDEGDDDDDDDDGPNFDIGTPPDGDSEGEPDKECDVDLLFVIDNSLSMAKSQRALGMAFPRFVDALKGALPPATNLHVAVTSSEMGYSAVGRQNDNDDGSCEFSGDDFADHTEFYVTPDQLDTGRNGAQGRLYVPSAGMPYFDIDMDATKDEFDELAVWFERAADLGTEGSNIEMLLAPLLWLDHPANAATNGGFLRDKGTVLVTFFISDEPDQTPIVIDGQNASERVLDRLIAAKTACGGLDCVVAGGFVDPTACNDTRPLASFLDGLTRPPQVTRLVGALTPEETAEWMADFLGDTLLAAVDETCESISPPE